MEPAGDEAKREVLSQGLRLNLKPEGLTQIKSQGKSIPARGNSMRKDPAEGMLGKLEEDRRLARLEAGGRWEMRKK